MATEIQTQAPIQRPLRGSRISSFYPVKSLPALSSLDSAFQLQEYISLLIRLDVHDVDRIVSLPGANKDAKEKESKEGEKLGKGGDENKDGEGDKDKDEKDVTVDEACWIYEQLRRLAQDLTHPLITTLQQECSRTSCPEMKAGEWLYLCVAHGNEGAMEQCCAIDYILHTLDSATALLNSPRAFPSRLQIPGSSHRHFSSLARRLGRIFAHAYFHHREAFEQAEAESSLYARFLALTSKFELVPPEFLVIPTTSTPEDEDEDDEHGRREGSTFGEREVKLGTSYDPRRGLGHHTILRQQRQQQRQQQQQQQHGPFQGDFPDIPRTRRPQQPQQPQHHQPQPQPQQLHDIQTQVQPGVDGTESPRKLGRNRTDTMVLSEVAGIVDDLAKAAAATKADEERQRKEHEEEREEEPEAAQDKEKEAGERTYASVAAETAAKEEEQGEKADAEAEVGKDEQEQATEEKDERPSAQDVPEIEISTEQPSPSEETVGDEAKETSTPGETAVSDSAEVATATIEVEVSEKMAEDTRTSTTANDEPSDKEEKGETAEGAEGKSDEESSVREDDIGDGPKDADEPELETKEAAEGERAGAKSDAKSDAEVAKEAT